MGGIAAGRLGEQTDPIASGSLLGPFFVVFRSFFRGFKRGPPKSNFLSQLGHFFMIFVVFSAFFGVFFGPDDVIFGYCSHGPFFECFFVVYLNFFSLADPYLDTYFTSPNALFHF